MDTGTLRSEFLRLSSQYPQLRHALIVGNEHRPIDPKLSCSWLESFGFTVIGLGEPMANDARADYFALWKGDVDFRNEDSYGPVHLAELSFEALARSAAQSVTTEPFPGRISRAIIVSGSGHIIAKKGQPPLVVPHKTDDSFCDWLGHIFQVESVIREKVDFQDGNGNALATCEGLVLPSDSFHASFVALDETRPTDEGADGQRTFTADDRMKAELAANLEVVKGWTVRHWANYLGVSKSTVAETKTWKSLRSLRAETRAQQQMDRHRKRKSSKRHY